jgi:hypothetical protein
LNSSGISHLPLMPGAKRAYFRCRGSAPNAALQAN